MSGLIAAALGHIGGKPTPEGHHNAAKVPYNEKIWSYITYMDTTIRVICRVESFLTY